MPMSSPSIRSDGVDAGQVAGPLASAAVLLRDEVLPDEAEPERSMAHRLDGVW